MAIRGRVLKLAFLIALLLAGPVVSGSHDNYPLGSRFAARMD